MGYAAILTRARARKGEAQGVLTYQKVTGIFDNPHIYIYTFYFDHANGLVVGLFLCQKNEFQGFQPPAKYF